MYFTTSGCSDIAAEGRFSVGADGAGNNARILEASFRLRIDIDGKLAFFDAPDIVAQMINALDSAQEHADIGVC